MREVFLTTLFEAVQYPAEHYIAQYYESKLSLYILVEGTLWQFTNSNSAEVAKVRIVLRVIVISTFKWRRRMKRDSFCSMKTILIGSR